MNFQNNNKTITDKILDRAANIAFIIGGLAFLIDRLFPNYRFLFWLFIYIGTSILIGTFISSFKSIWNKKYTSKIFYSFFISGLLILNINYGIKYQKNKILTESINDFEVKLQSLKWIAYEPINFNPYTNNFGTIDNIKTELNTLFNHNCTGIITFGIDSILRDIPRIARELKGDSIGIIMGIINVNDKKELEIAIREAPYVDAYCVGHMFTDYSITKKDIINALNYIRKNTNKPVTTTLRPNGYMVFPEISKNVDWFFPDIHGNWYSKACSKTIFQQSKLYIEELKHVQKTYPNKPILLKMISFPSAEVENATTGEQYNFFRLIIEHTESSMSFPDRMYPSFFSAFDLSWKTPEKNWPLGERFVGFFDTLGMSKTVFKNDSIKVVEALYWSRIKQKY
jgi:hypothetical protein